MTTSTISTMHAAADARQVRPTRARHVTLAFMLGLAVITYIDRVSLSTAAPFIRSELGLSSIQLGWALSTFAWAYSLFEIPGGWLGDRLGPRRVLMRIVIWWSVFTAATGRVWNLPSLIGCQALFGAGEAGAFPNITRVFTTWIPTKERERAQALLWLATRWGGALTPLAVKLLLQYVSWRAMFGLFGLIGLAWAIGFYRWYRDDPHPSARQPRRGGPAAAAAGVGDRPRAAAVAAPAVAWVGRPAVRPVRVSGLRLVLLRDMAADVPARCASYAARGVADPPHDSGRRAAPVRRRRMSRLGLARPAAGAGHGQRDRSAAHAGDHRIRRRVGGHPDLYPGPGPDLRDARARRRRIPERLRHAHRLGEHDGHRRPVRRHGLGRHEHVRRHRRRLLHAHRRLHPRVDVQRLDAGAVQPRRRSTSSARSAGSSWIRTRPSKRARPSRRVHATAAVNHEFAAAPGRRASDSSARPASPDGAGWSTVSSGHVSPRISTTGDGTSTIRASFPTLV